MKHWKRTAVASLAISLMGINAVFTGLGSIAHGTERSEIIIGPNRDPGARPISDAFFTLPEAAVMASDGTIYIANTYGGTIEAATGDTIETLIDGKVGEHLYSDLSFDRQGNLIVLEGGPRASIVRLNPATKEQQVVAKAPKPTSSNPTAFLSISSAVENEDGRLLVTGRPAIVVSQSQLSPIGDSALYEVVDGEWRVLWTAETLGIPPGPFRDAVYLKDGSIAFIAGQYFVVAPSAGEPRKIHIGSDYGGGIVEHGKGFLIGSYTSLLRIPADLSGFTAVETPYGFANVTHLSKTPDGQMLLTDSDRQTVYLFDPDTLEAVRRIGNQGDALSFRSILPDGDGGILLLDGITPRISRYDIVSGERTSVAGDGEQGYSGPAPADEFSFLFPNDMAVGPDGTIFVTEANYRIVAVRNGEVEYFAGDVHSGVPVPGEQAATAKFGALRGLDVDRLGRVWVTDQTNHSVYRIETDGTVIHIMGTGEPGLWQEGEFASAQPLNQPADIIVLDDGSALVADSYNNAIVRISAGGIVSAFAGVPAPITYQGLGGFAGDGGPATEALLNTPRGLSADDAGNVYVVDQFNHSIRRVSPDGTIDTVAGGTFGFNGEPTHLSYPSAACVAGNALIVADTGNASVWAIPF